MKEPACCFTGHRPQKFHFGYDEEYEDCIWLKEALAREIKAMLDGGITTFYTGMALGTDMWCAEIVQSFQKSSPELGVRLNAVIPCEGQANKWSNDYRERYFNILSRADGETILNAHYTKDCMRQRNQYMVDRSTHIIAVYNGSAGGTKNTLDYAKSKNLTIITIDPQTIGMEMSPPLRRFNLLKGEKGERK